MFFNDLVQINGDVDLDLMKIIHQSVLNQCDGFYVEYQPVVHAQTGEIAGAEALVRWKKEPYGIVPPGMSICPQNSWKGKRSVVLSWHC